MKCVIKSLLVIVGVLPFTLAASNSRSSRDYGDRTNVSQTRAPKYAYVQIRPPQNAGLNFVAKRTREQNRQKVKDSHPPTSQTKS